MIKIIEKNKLKQEKDSDFIEEIEKATIETKEVIENAIIKQKDFLTSDDILTNEKIKEYARLAIFLPTMLFPKILILISYGLPAYIISKIFFGYFGLMPDNSETENKTIKAINSKTGMNFLLKNRPIFYKEIRHIAQDKVLEKIDNLKNKAKKIIRV